MARCVWVSLYVSRCSSVCHFLAVCLTVTVTVEGLSTESNDPCLKSKTCFTLCVSVYDYVCVCVCVRESLCVSLCFRERFYIDPNDPLKVLSGQKLRWRWIPVEICCPLFIRCFNNVRTGLLRPMILRFFSFKWLKRENRRKKLSLHHWYDEMWTTGCTSHSSPAPKKRWMVGIGITTRPTTQSESSKW